MKKTFVLVILFIFPIVAYLFFASGINNFGKLPILTQDITNAVEPLSSDVFDDKITILGFLGDSVLLRKGNAFNLNQKIYKRFSEFKDFQFVMMVSKGSNVEVEELKKELGVLSNIDKWEFTYASREEIKILFKGLESDVTLDNNLSTSYVFIIDKDRNLRGRKDDEDDGTKYGFNTTSVAELNNKMEDDVKIILAEYRLALKKNNADRAK